MCGDFDRFIAHLLGGAQDGGAANRQAAAAEGAGADWLRTGIAVTDDDIIVVCADLVGDHLGEGRLQALPVRRGAGVNGDGAAGLDAHLAAFVGTEAAHFDIGRQADAQQLASAVGAALGLLFAEGGVIRGRPARCSRFASYSPVS